MPDSTISSWSFTSLLLFEKCPYAAKLKHVDKIAEPQNKWSERGVQIHSAAEAYIKGDTPKLADELSSFDAELCKTRELYSSGKVEVEGEWAHDKDWAPTDWRSKEAWVRLKLDAKIEIGSDAMLVVDLKSGKKFGNEIKHAEQGQLYAGVTFLRNPMVKKVVVEFWYVDQNDLTRVEYNAAQASKFLAGFDKRARAMTQATSFPARPSIFTCKWCAYRPESAGGGGQCEFGIDPNNIPVNRFRR